MEGEIGNFIKVWASISVSILYCYAVTKIVAKGIIRLIIFIPVVCLFLFLPFALTSVHLGTPTIFVISWLANFKLLLLASGHGPLSDPSISMGRFVCIACLPIKVQKTKISNQPKIKSPPIREEHHLAPNNWNNSSLKKLAQCVMKAFILAFLVGLAQWKEHLNPNMVLFYVCLYVYVGLDLMLSIVASIGQVLLGVELENPFNAPYLSTSLGDFWGQRWNRMASDSLRSAVFMPTFHYSSRKLGRKWGRLYAFLTTFLVSAVMHELVLYYLGRTRPTCNATLFFLIHGMVLGVETELKEKFMGKWKLSQLISGPCIFGFMILTFMWLISPEILNYKVDTRAFEEFVALVQFLNIAGFSGNKVVTT